MKKFNYTEFINKQLDKMQNKMVDKAVKIKNTVKYNLLVDKYNPLKWYIVKSYSDRHYTAIQFVGSKKTVKLHRVGIAKYNELIKSNYIVNL